MSATLIFLAGVFVGFAAKALLVYTEPGRMIYRRMMPRVTLSRAHFDLLSWRARQGAAIAPRPFGEPDPTVEVERAIDQAEGSL